MAVDPSDLNMQTPLLRYIATAIKNGGQLTKTGDLKLPFASSKRVAVGIDERKTIYLAFQSDEAFVFQTFTINEVSFVRNVSQSDWVVIRTPDASNGRGKIKNGKISKEIPMRFWFPANKGTFDGFAGIPEDKQISFIEMSFVNHHPEASGEVIFEVPLKLRGKWDDLEIIEESMEEEIPTEVFEDSQEAKERIAPTGKDDILAGEDSLDITVVDEDVDIPDDLNINYDDLIPDDI